MFSLIIYDKLKAIMSLTYAEKVAINRERELNAYKEELVRKLEDSKKLVMDCDNLVKMRALNTRIHKISKPRSGPGYNESQKIQQRKKYQQDKDKISQKSKQKREEIKRIGSA